MVNQDATPEERGGTASPDDDLTSENERSCVYRPPPTGSATTPSTILLLSAGRLATKPDAYSARNRAWIWAIEARGAIPAKPIVLPSLDAVPPCVIQIALAASVVPRQG